MRFLRVLVALTFGCAPAPSPSSPSSPPSSTSALVKPTPAGMAPTLGPSPSAVTSADARGPHDAIAEWREGRPEPAQRNVAPFADLGIAPIVVVRRGRSGAVALHVIAVSDGAALDVRLRAEIRCKVPAQQADAEFSIGGAIGELDESGKPDFAGTGLGAFGRAGAKRAEHTSGPAGRRDRRRLPRTQGLRGLDPRRRHLPVRRGRWAEPRRRAATGRHARPSSGGGA